MRPALGLLVAVLSCSHAQPAPAAGAPSTPGGGARDRGGTASAAEARVDVRAISDELHALLREEAERVWTRWTTGAGPLPSGALAQHPKLFLKESVDGVAAALASASSPEDRLALRLLHAELATLAVSRESAPDADDLERARATLAFAAPGDRRAERSNGSSWRRRKRRPRRIWLLSPSPGTRRCRKPSGGWGSPPGPRSSRSCTERPRRSLPISPSVP
ncbi:MAG: hypothetical protein E6J85_04790 [Deltaproteobacteria bacterium]|nr:MAG: hypothetical protein E6J85_04790 [Deltaproteobacteria bacterium]